MTTHTFTLIIDGPDLQADALIDDVFEAGCDDALIGRADGIQFADFDRDADTFQDAVLTAVAELESIRSVTVMRLANAGLVSMADIAARTGRTRESVRLLITGKRGPGGFPPPVTDPRSRYRLWRSDEVAAWLRENLNVLLSDTAGDHVRAAISATLELRHHRTHLNDAERSDLRTLVDS
ncbi:helix-turn-helix transcriptional regulator [Candidatus Poriferisodalis sp.]|uniref:helix-turn-helix transcriptional regulator n=1 Tax=Candidatus Poriferisodalis sp. TaxID=3101277 RepID=UPI003AF5F3C7